MLHGGDYNPDQWLGRPDILEEDIRLMKLANVNCVSVGIFAWAAYEPHEGQYTFEWMDQVLDRLHKAGVSAILATPSGAKPNWMALKYEEIRRVDRRGQRDPQWHRHNHCYTSPVYREKVAIMNTKLAERYGKHPAVAMWHISNEYGGDCHCPLCKNAFREYLKKKYKTLEALNDAYWSRFWSHTYTDWNQVDALDTSVHGLIIDWKRFVTAQTTDFMLHEMKPLRAITPNIPITINMMGFYDGLDYWRMAPHIDLVSWDAYPGWHKGELYETAAHTAFTHDVYRPMKQGKPWLLMECTPSNVNWQGVSPLKRPGVHRLSGLQAVAHGSDGVLYFQFRKGRGSGEKFHGAIVDHVGHENTRVFKEVSQLGADLAKMKDITGTTTPADVALIFDWDNRWAIQEEQGPRNEGKEYHRTCYEFYLPLWKRGVACDVIDEHQPLDKYKLVIAPMLYMVKGDLGDRLAKFVQNGGTLITTYLSGYVNETDLVLLGGFPGGKESALRKAAGIWAEEIDALNDDEIRKASFKAGNSLGLSGEYSARQYFEILHAEGAQVAAEYTSDFYKDTPAVTVNSYGKGKVIHVAARFEQKFNDDLIASLVKSLKPARAIETDLPAGVSAVFRTDGTTKFVFLMNFTNSPQTVKLPANAKDLDGKQLDASIKLPPYGGEVVLT
jgi:beta-galactosidase